MIEQTVSPSPTRIFVSYSHEDTEQKRKVMTILRALPPRIGSKIEIKIEPWDDTRMLGGMPSMPRSSPRSNAAMCFWP